mmetsp:Transcript_88361/g.210972  ORF Transcript_88361/g.210972 Transcript_88361/m.210972 type:complete len:211 (+) Transcript_88361:552-1184(+)
MTSRGFRLGGASSTASSFLVGFCPSSSLAVQRASHAKSRFRSRSASGPFPRRPMGFFAYQSVSSRWRLPSSISSFPRPRFLSSRRRRLRLRLLLLLLLLLLFASGAASCTGSFGGGSPLLSHTRAWTACRSSRQSPISGKVCMIFGQLPLTQSLNRFASAMAALFSKHRNCARKHFGAQSYAVLIGTLAYRSSRCVLSNHSVMSVCMWQL